MGELVSIIIPTYNEEEDINFCLESLQKQTYKPLEIIVVDDGSTDSTAEIVRKFNVKLIIQPHAGPGPARNLGASHVKGKILVFVDSDMTFDPDFITKLTLPILNKKSLGTYSQDEIVSNWDIVWSRCWNFNNNNKTSKRVRNNPHDQEDFRAILASEFKRVGGFNSTGYTDSRTLVTKLNSKPAIAPGARYYHRNPSSLSEVFNQAVWIGRRQTKFGRIGQLVNLFRHSLPVSMLLGIYVSIRFQEPLFIIFKPIHDLGFCWGILSNILWQQTAR